MMFQDEYDTERQCLFSAWEATYISFLIFHPNFL